MIRITKNVTHHIPYLTIVKHEDETKALPTVIYFHGFTSAKEHNLPFAYLLAEKGFRVILPDSMHHGERDTGSSFFEKGLSFWNIVMQNVADIQEIKDALDEQGLILQQKIGLAGTSMGGITTAAALTTYPWIHTAAILMGSPQLTAYAQMLVENVVKKEKVAISEEEIERLITQIKTYDLSLQPEKLAERPLMFWHGDQDSVVPYDLSYSFYKKVRKHYTNKDKLKFSTEKNRDHKVSRMAILQTVEWFNAHLNDEL